ncbi:ABC transporter permease [Tissierella sp. MSJ-40]|uniref:Autoinducer 2 import system permease protein LsrC n=1 Tax=Tissierella simiarum TaxID=2841534 RepID=A0ABS6E1U7_9FIRM|nr:ABC transporter permease [Tissierella simiarum]MBU5436867.1 ABC transporter permease [Tissierella simiarum]
MLRKYVPQPSKREYITFILLLLEILLFGMIADNFLSLDNIVRVIQNSAEIALVSIGMTMVMLLGGIDLSVGSTMGIVAIVAGKMIQGNSNNFVVLIVAMGLGIILGTINGLIITKFKIPDIIVTLATMNIWRAMIFMMLGGKWITGLNSVFSKLTTGKILGIPVLLLVIIAFYALFYYITMYRPFGRHLYATGSNIQSAELLGINANKIKIISYSLLGLMVGLASILYISRMGSVEMTIGSELSLQCIAAVTLGGTSVKGKGGKGSLIGTLAGVFFIAFLRNGIVILGVPSLLENAFIGMLIIGSILFDFFLDKKKVAKAA